MRKWWACAFLVCIATGVFSQSLLTLEQAIQQALQNNYGVDPKRLTAGGRGEYNPVASNDTEEGRRLNRRTQIIITPKLDQFMQLINKAPASDSTSTAP